MLTAFALIATLHMPCMDTVRVRLSSAPAATTATAASTSAGSAIGVADSMVLNKREHRLTLFAQGHALRSYLVALGANPSGPKLRRGDGRTPEGLYRIDSRNPQSQYHLSLHISYPSDLDRVRAQRAGVSPGGDIMIHGLPDRFASVGALHRQQDWTLGCVAVTDAEIEEIWRAVPDGTPILIVP